MATIVSPEVSLEKHRVVCETFYEFYARRHWRHAHLDPHLAAREQRYLAAATESWPHIVLQE